MERQEYIALVADYIQSLKAHDWYYDRSEDGRVYRRGYSEMGHIEGLRKAISQANKYLAEWLWNRYAPSGYKITREAPDLLSTEARLYHFIRNKEKQLRLKNGWKMFRRGYPKAKKHIQAVEDDLLARIGQ